MDAEATSTADMDVPFATGDAPGTDAITTVIIVVVSTGVTAAVVSAKLMKSRCYTVLPTSAD